MKPKVFKSDKKGAVIVSRDTSIALVEVRPASKGLRKVKGCWQFFPEFGYNDEQRLNKKECKAKYYDWPEDGTAYLVYPCGSDFWWKCIDNLISSSGDFPYVPIFA